MGQPKIISNPVLLPVRLAPVKIRSRNRRNTNGKAGAFGRNLHPCFRFFREHRVMIANAVFAYSADLLSVNRCFTRDRLFTTGGLVLPQVAWFHVIARSPSCSDWSVIGGSAGFPSAASKLTLTWLSVSTQCPKWVTVPFPASSVTVAVPSRPRLTSIEGPGFASSPERDAYVPANLAWVVGVAPSTPVANTNQAPSRRPPKGRS